MSSLHQILGLSRRAIAWLAGVSCVSFIAFGAAAAAEIRAPIKLLNVSFDVSRELFTQLNRAFEPWYRTNFGAQITVSQSHAGASKQARSVIDGVDADVVTLNTVSDINLIARRGRLLREDWRSLRPYHSSPYSSVVVFVVRKGNPKGIRDWGDLVGEGIQLAVANPKTSGTARLAYLSAWSYALRAAGGDEGKAGVFMADFYAHAPVLDTGARGATITFVQRRVGDVLITLEAEQRIVGHEYADAGFEVVYPSLSVDAEMPVAIVDRIAKKHQTEAAASAYLDFLYTRAAQTIMAQNHFRPRLPEALAESRNNFPTLELIDVDRDLGGWDRVMAKHFAEGGIFDQAYDRNR